MANEEEEKTKNEDDDSQLRSWARKHYKPFSKIDPLWCEVVKQECEKINRTQRKAAAEGVMSEIIQDMGLAYVSQR